MYTIYLHGHMSVLLEFNYNILLLFCVQNCICYLSWIVVPGFAVYLYSIYVLMYLLVKHIKGYRFK